MKKTLIALAVAASAAVSGTAMAALGSFDAGNVNNTVDFGGSIVPGNNNKWVWAVGQGYGDFSHKTYDMSDKGKKLTIFASENMPLLVGKVTEAFKGAVGLAPQIQFSDSKGVITPVWAAAHGEGTLTLTVNNASQEEIGTLTLNVNAVAPAVWAKLDRTSDILGRYLENVNNAFTDATGAFGDAVSFAEADSITTAFGAPTVQEIQDQIRAYPGLSNVGYDVSGVLSASGDDFTDDTWAYAVSYALGVLNGKTLELNLNSPVNFSAETNWKASLTMQISYT